MVRQLRDQRMGRLERIVLPVSFHHNSVCHCNPIILQKAVEVKNGDTPETLQKRIMEEAEWKILPQAVSLFCEDRIIVKNGVTEIR